MKTRKIFIGLTIVLILLALGFISESRRVESEKKVGEKAVTFNNEIVASQAQISEKIRELDDKLSVIDVKTEAITLIEQVIVDVDVEIQKIEKLESPQQSGEFKNSTLELYNYYKQILEGEYKSKLIPLFYEEIKTLSIEEFTKKNNLILSEINSNIVRLTDEFIKSQKNFAAEFNLELED